MPTIEDLVESGNSAAVEAVLDDVDGKDPALIGAIYQLISGDLAEAMGLDSKARAALAQYLPHNKRALGLVFELLPGDFDGTFTRALEPHSGLLDDAIAHLFAKGNYAPSRLLGLAMRWASDEQVELLADRFKDVESFRMTLAKELGQPRLGSYAIPILLKIIKAGNNYLCSVAIESVIKKGSDEDILKAAVIGAQRTYGDDSAMSMTIDALRKLGDPGNNQLLLSIMCHEDVCDDYPEIVDKARSALIEVTLGAGVEHLIVDYRNEQARLTEFATTLDEITGEDIALVDTLKSLIIRSTDDDVIEGGLAALGRYLPQHTEARRFLISRLAGDDAYFVSEILKPHPQLLPDLLAFLSQSDELLNGIESPEQALSLAFGWSSTADDRLVVAKRFVNHDSHYARQFLAAELAELGSKALPLLKDFLEDRTEAVRLSAAVSLSTVLRELNDAQHVPLLVTLFQPDRFGSLADSTSVQNHMSAVREAVVAIDPTADLQALFAESIRQGLESDEFKTKEAILRQVIAIAPDLTVLPVIQSICEDPKALDCVRGYAFTALGQFIPDHPQVRDYLLGLLARGFKLAAKAQVLLKPAPECLDRVLELLSEGVECPQYALELAVGWAPCDERVRAQVLSHREHPTAHVRIVVARALVDYGALGVSALLELMEDTMSYVRKPAFEVLIAIADRETLLRVAPLALKDSDLSSECIEALKEIGGQEAIKHLSKVIAAPPDEWAADEAREAIEAIEPGFDVDALLVSLRG